MNFENKFPNWENEGTEPSRELTSNGFQAGYKPPAALFNWFWSKVIKAITEIQVKLNARTKVYEAYSEDGLHYDVTAPNFEAELGSRIMVMPNKTCEVPDCKFSINGVGYNVLQRRLKSGDYDFISWRWLVAGELYTLIVEESVYGKTLCVEGIDMLPAENLEGSVPVHKGGTGANNAEGARKNIGAAPSGYGLGEENGKPISDCNVALLAGFYCLSGESTVNTPSEYFSMKFGSLFVEKRHAAIYQTLTYNNVVAKRYSTDSGATWQPWEFVNPPMVADVEYRTTERWEGAPVYTTIVDCGKTVASTKTQKLTNIACGAIVRISGRIGGYTTPYIYEVIDSKYSTWATAHNQNGYLQVNTYAGADTGNLSAKIQVWYTK